MTRLIFIACALLAACAAGAVPADCATFPAAWVSAPACTGKKAATRPLCQRMDLAGYTLAWSDEFVQSPTIAFDGHGDSTWVAGAHANLGPGGVRADPNDGRAYAVAGGVLALSTYKTASGGLVEANLQSWSAHARHPAPLANFYVEARLRGPQGAHSHAGLWLLSDDNGAAGASGGHTEVDIVEQYGPGDPYDHATSHIWPGARRDIAHQWLSTLTARPEGRAMGWHVYGLRADAATFTVYRDGLPIRQIARQPEQQRPLYVLLSLFALDAQATPDTMLVDYVRVYAPR